MKEILAIFAFLTYISIEKAHSLKWSKEGKTQNKILIFQGNVDFSKTSGGGVWEAGVCMHHGLLGAYFIHNLVKWML